VAEVDIAADPPFTLGGPIEGFSSGLDSPAGCRWDFGFEVAIDVDHRSGTELAGGILADRDPVGFGVPSPDMRAEGPVGDEIEEREGGKGDDASSAADRRATSDQVSLADDPVERFEG
jgi:hypothetical protein